MSSMSRGKRGKHIQEIGLAIDRKLHPHGVFCFAEGPHGKANAPTDWVRGKDRVELKSCGLTFDRSNNRWRCFFQRIKPNLFDELWLGLYTSVAIHYYRSKCCKCVRFCKAGAVTKVYGQQLHFYGPQGELDPLAALRIIQAKMTSAGCELVATVEWETGSSMGDACGSREAGKSAQSTSI